jgi:hypothetical protein
MSVVVQTRLACAVVFKMCCRCIFDAIKCFLSFSVQLTSLIVDMMPESERRESKAPHAPSVVIRAHRENPAPESRLPPENKMLPPLQRIQTVGEG